ncbi:hypothetical protein D3C87_1666720 [compost metagenome]
MPMLPLAPGLLSTTIGWLKVWRSEGLIRRAMVSPGEPGGNATSSRSGLLGQASWARTASGASPPSSATASSLLRHLFIVVSSLNRKSGSREASDGSPRADVDPDLEFAAVPTLDVRGRYRGESAALAQPVE